MLDALHLLQPFGPNADVQVFNVPSTVSNTQWHTWLKPRGKSMVFMFLIGGGAGGGGGFTAAASSARGGGGGGGSSGVTRILVPAFLLPDKLFIQVGAGGAGVGSGGGTAGSGVASYICICPDNNDYTNLITASVGNVPTGGGTGTGAAVGAGGGGGTAPSSVTTFNNLGLLIDRDGQAGSAGGAVAGGAGVAATLPSQVITTGGSGGGGTTSADFAGGVISSIPNSFLSEYRPAGAAAGSNAGSGGFLLGPPSAPWFSYPGLGGGSSNAGVGGNGGNGGPGSGGGGGGGGTTGGRGGDGGPGLVIIACW